MAFCNLSFLSKCAELSIAETVGVIFNLVLIFVLGAVSQFIIYLSTA